MGQAKRRRFLLGWESPAQMIKPKRWAKRTIGTSKNLPEETEKLKAM